MVPLETCEILDPVPPEAPEAQPPDGPEVPDAPETPPEPAPDGPLPPQEPPEADPPAEASLSPLSGAIPHVGLCQQCFVPTTERVIMLPAAKG